MKLNIPTRDFGAFIFDCDGTLVDSMPLHHRAWGLALRELGATFEFDWALFTSRAGMGMTDTVRELNAQFGLRMDPDAVAAAQSAHYASLLPQLTVVKPVVEFARSQRRVKPMAVASGGERALVRRGLAQCGLLDWFEPIVCQQDVSRGKPEPEMFLRCASLMAVPPERCLVFEDGEMGIEAAQRANMAWVAVDETGRCSG